MSAATPSAPPSEPSSTLPPKTATSTPGASPAPTSGSSDPRTPPTAATADPDADLSTPPTGPIPLDRHQKILAKARKDAESKVRADVDRELGPWKMLSSQFTPDEFQTVLPQLQALSRQPALFIQRAAEQMGYRLVPLGQQTPQGPAGPSQQTGEPPIPPMETTDDLQRYLQQRDRWIAQQLRQELDTELRPLREARQEQERTQFMRGIDDKAAQQIADLSQEEGFEELKPHMAEIIRNDGRATLESAYRRAYREHYKPTRDQKLRQAWQDELQAKGRAATTSLAPQRRSAAQVGGGHGDQPSIREMLEQATAAAGVSY